MSEGIDDLFRGNLLDFVLSEFSARVEQYARHLPIQSEPHRLLAGHRRYATRECGINIIFQRSPPFHSPEIIENVPLAGLRIAFTQFRFVITLPNMNQRH